MDDRITTVAQALAVSKALLEKVKGAAEHIRLLVRG